MCIEYRGRTECRSALAADRDTARSQAVGDACATLSSGVTDGIQCNAQEPLQMTCTP